MIDLSNFQPDPAAVQAAFDADPVLQRQAKIIADHYAHEAHRVAEVKRNLAVLRDEHLVLSRTFREFQKKAELKLHQIGKQKLAIKKRKVPLITEATIDKRKKAIKKRLEEEFLRKQAKVFRKEIGFNQ